MLKTLLTFLPDAIKALSALVRRARQPQIAYSRTKDGRWIANFKGCVFVGDSRPEAAQGALRQAVLQWKL